MLSITHIVTISITVLSVIALGLYSVRSVKDASDFAVGGQSASSTILIGTLVGTIVGGSSTIGTAQLAFTYGLSAWWFTLGAGVALLILGAFFARPLRDSNAKTGPEILGNAYGKEARPLSSVFSSIGIFLNIIAQILAAVALLTTVFKLPPLLAALIAILLVISYVIFGGVMGTGIVGIWKMILVYFSVLFVIVMAYFKTGGLTGFTSNLPASYFNIFGRGVAVDLAAGFSLIIGVMSTQTYLQAIFSGKTVNDSRRAGLISGALIPPLGIGGILVGMHMKIYFPDIVASEAFPLFVLHYLPDWAGGIVLATILVSIVGTGAGLVLGVATMVSEDLYRDLLKKDASDQQVLMCSRLTIVFVTSLTFFFTIGNMNSMILQWAFISMALRGSAVCLPLVGALFFKDKVRPKAGIWAVGMAPLLTMIWALFFSHILDPLYIGLGVGLIILVFGSIGYKPADKKSA